MWHWKIRHLLYPFIHLSIQPSIYKGFPIATCVTTGVNCCSSTRPDFECGEFGASQLTRRQLLKSR
jgi:regulation of enolase protein 1 (concanavalin A-like superfamily)